MVGRTTNARQISAFAMLAAFGVSVLTACVPSSDIASVPELKPSAPTVTGPAVYSFKIDESSYVNSTTLKFSISGSLGTATSFCVLENDTLVDHCVWQDFPLPATLTVSAADGAKTISLFVKDAAGNLSTRADSNTVTLDRTAPATPTTLVSTPTSPSMVQTPLIKGSLPADAAGMIIYSDAGCTLEVGRGTRQTFTTTGILSIAGANSTTNFFGQSYDLAGNQSACLALLSYVHQANIAVPLTVGFLSLAPASPAANPAPSVVGYTSSDIQTVNIYKNSACTQQIGAGTKADFEGAGIPITALSNQTTVLFAKGQDGASGFSACTLLSTYQHDDVAPVNISGITLAALNNSITSSPVVHWVSGGSDAGSGFSKYEYAIGSSSGGSDVKNWSLLTGGSPQSFGGLSLTNMMTYYVSFRAIDVAGNISTAASSSGWTVDVTAPAAPPAFASFSPASPSNSNLTPAVIGTVGTDTADVLLYADAGCSNLLASGTRAQFIGAGITVNVNPNTSTAIYGRGRDDATNVSACALLGTFTHDNTPPVLGGLTISGGSYLNTTSIGITFGGVSGGATEYCVQENNTTVGSCAWTAFPLPSAFTLAGTNGTRQLSAWVRDAAGNVSSRTDSNSVVLDTVNPVWGAPGLSYAATSAQPNSSPIAAFSMSATDANPITYQYALGSGTAGAAITDVVGWTTTASASFQAIGLALVDGNTYYLRVRAVDAAGNATISAPNAGFAVSVVVPPPTYSSAVPGSPNNTSPSPNITGLADPTVESVSLYSDAGCTTLLGSGTRSVFQSTGINITVTANVNTGIYGRATDTDVAKNSSCVYLTTYVYDTQAPLAPLSVDDTTWNNSLTVSPTITWSGGGVDGGAGFNRFEYAIGTTAGAQNIRAWTSAGAVYSVVATGLSLTNGSTYYASVRAVDNVGNTSTATQANGWTVDTAAPVVSLLDPAEAETIVTEQLLIRGACDDSSVVNITYGAGAAGVASALCISGAYSATVTFTGIDGNRVLTIGQTDAAGNASTPITRTVNWQPTFNTFADGLSSTVRAIAFANDGSRTILAGGDFTDIGGISTARLIKFKFNGERDTTFSVGTGFNAAVYKVLPAADGSGKIYVAGSFTDYDGSGLKYLVRLDADGSVDSSFNLGTGMNGAVYNLEYGPGSKIFAGGAFTSVNGVATYSKLVLLNDDGSVDTSFDVSTGGALNGDVWSIRMAADGNSVFVGGAFTTFRGNTVNRVMKLAITNGTLAAGWATGATAGFTTASSIVYALLLAPDDTTEIYAAGSFTAYGATANSALRIARLTSNGALSGTFNAAAGATNGFNGLVRTLAAATDGTNEILCGGDFTTWRGGAATNYAVRLSNAGIQNTTFLVRGFGAAVHTLAIGNTTDNPSFDVMVGGAFTAYGSAGVGYIARLTASGVLDVGLDPGSGIAGGSGYVRDVEFTKDYTKRMYLGGSFTSYRGVSSPYLVRVNRDGSIDSSFSVGTGFNNLVLDAEVDAASGDVYVAGSFTTYNGAAAGTYNRIIRLNSDGSVDAGFSIGTGFNNIVRKIMMAPDSSGDIYVLGDFTTYKGLANNRIIRLTNTGAVATSFNAGSGLNASGYWITPVNDGTTDVYVNGAFTTYNGTSKAYIVRLTASGLINGVFNAGAVNNAIYQTITADNGTGDIYIGGTFTSIQARATASLARLKSSGAYDSSYDVGAGLQYYNGTTYVGGVYGIGKDSSGRITATGVFNRYYNTSYTLSRILRLNTNGSIDGSFNLGTGINATGYGLTYIPDGSQDFVVFGDFTTFNGLARNGLIRLRDNGDPN